MFPNKMLLPSCWTKSVHMCKAYFSTVDKSLLAKLRKSTGYTIINCKKALEINKNNVEDAEKWLQETAKKEGWEKAMKLKDRVAQEGLIGIHICDNIASIVEVSCETDFVARNNYFQGLVSTVAKAVYSSNLVQTPEIHVESYSITKKLIMVSELPNLDWNDSKLSDAIAIAIHQLGENIVLRRAMAIIAGEGISLSAYCHPAVERREPTLYGKHGAIVAFTQDPPKEEVGWQLCQQIIGTKPTHVGHEEDEGSYDIDQETALVHQEFLFNLGTTVGEFLADEEAKVIDFIRFSCGEVPNTLTSTANSKEAIA